jgi:S-formylglutathione hydrolase
MRARTHLTILIVLSLLFTTVAAIAQDGRIVRETVYSPSLEGNLFGDSPNRQVTIYLPPSYEDSPDMAYPVVYLLHGYTDNNELWTTYGDIRQQTDSLLKDGSIKEMIVVMPNSYNRFYGSWYTNSTTTGNWADYIAVDLVHHIDSNYHTLPQRESRVVFGYSMGGYGGMKLGLQYPEVFGCMGSTSGLLDLTQYPNTVSWAYAQAATLKNLSDFNSQQFAVKMAIAECAAFTPNPDNPPFYADFPWERDASNKIVRSEEVWDRFMEQDILTQLEANAEALLSMRAIYIDCGTSDDFSFLTDLRRVGDELQRLGVPHQYREFSGDHNCCFMTNVGEALKLFSNAMEFEMLVVSGVESMGKLATAWGKIKSN